MARGTPSPPPGPKGRSSPRSHCRDESARSWPTRRPDPAGAQKPPRARTYRQGGRYSHPFWHQHPRPTAACVPPSDAEGNQAPAQQDPTVGSSMRRSAPDRTRAPRPPPPRQKDQLSARVGNPSSRPPEESIVGRQKCPSNLSGRQPHLIGIAPGKPFAGILSLPELEQLP